ncbi:TlpA family protein disulfide reductase [Thalassotalea piscium]
MPLLITLTKSMMNYLSNILVTIFISLSLLSYAQADTLSNFEHQLQQHKGKVVYLDFWASWCVPCRRSFPWMNELQKKHPTDLAIFSVNLDAEKSFAAQFLAETPANFTVFYDPEGEVAKAFKLRGMPSSYIFNRSGKIVSAHVGFNNEKQQAYQKEIERLITQSAD